MLDSTVCNIFPIDNNYFLWVQYTSESGQIWYVTSDKMRTMYQLWKGNKKTAKESDNPLTLYKHIK